MRYEVKMTARFRKELKAVKKRGCDISKLNNVVKILASGEALPPQFRDHSLSGDFDGKRECHIEPDWLLVYQIFNDELILLLTRTGSHSDLFRK